MSVREDDQPWIYDNYTCQASNAVNSSRFSIQLKRAGMFTVAEAIHIAFQFDF